MIILNKDKKFKILLLISGSIAAVRIPLLVSKLVKDNYNVKCVITKNAEKLIQPLSLSILSRNNCILDSDQWSLNTSKPLHIELTNWADILIMAPLTATTLSKWVCGNAEGLVSSILIANKKPIIVAPAMNTDMWMNNAVQKNYELAKKYNNVLSLQPSTGLLSCDQFGIGKIPPNDLISLALKFITNLNNKVNFHDLTGKKILITGGPTTEKIDPARNINNNSSGAMSLLLAQTANFRGADVTFIHGKLQVNPNLKEGITCHEINNSKELNDLIRNEIKKCDYFFMNAAVTDIKFKKQISSKIPKSNLKEFFSNNLELVPDILQGIYPMKKNNQKFIGFCAFTGNKENLKNIIAQKFKIKGCDLIFANPIDVDGQGFGEYSDNEGWLFNKDGLEYYFEKTTKLDLANKLINQIISIAK